MSCITDDLIKSAFTNLVSFLDNIMVGQLGTEPMSGVAIVLLLILNCIIWRFWGQLINSKYFL